MAWNMDKWWNNPFTQAGIGLLATNGRRDGGGIAGGLALGMRNYGSLQQQAQAQKQAEQKQAMYDAMRQNNPQLANWSNEHLDEYRKQQAAAMNRAPAKPGAPVKVMGPNGVPVYMSPQDAIGKQAFSQPMVSVSTGNQPLTQEQWNAKLRAEDQAMLGEGARKYYQDVNAAGLSAMGRVEDYNEMLSLLDSAYTGTGAEQAVAARRLGSILGFNVDEEALANSEKLQVLLGDELMSRVAQTKGAVSNKEMALFEQFSPSFKKSREGNRRILEYKRAKAYRDIAVRKLMTEWVTKGNMSTYDAQQKALEWIERPENSLSWILTQSKPSPNPFLEGTPYGNEAGTTGTGLTPFPSQ